MEISVLKVLNGDKTDILTIGLVIHLSCELDNINPVSTITSCPSTSRDSCAFSHIMNAQKSIYENRSPCERLGLPGRKTIERNGKDRLHNRLLDFFIEKSISLNSTNRNDRDNAWNTFLNSLWRLNEVKITRLDWKVKPPVELDQFLGFSFYDTSSNNGKRKRPSLNQDILSNLIKNIEYLQISNWLHPSSNIIPIFLDGLLRSVKAQMDACINKAQKMSTLRVVSTYQSIWRDLAPAELTEKHDIDITVLLPSETIADRYRELNAALAECQPYQPLMLHEYAPINRKGRHKYKKKIEVESDTMLLTIKHKGSIRHDIWIFKVDLGNANHDKDLVDTALRCVRKSSIIC